MDHHHDGVTISCSIIGTYSAPNLWLEIDKEDILLPSSMGDDVGIEVNQAGQIRQQTRLVDRRLHHSPHTTCNTRYRL